MSAATTTRRPRPALRWHAWFAVYVSLGALAVVGLVSSGWIVLGPVILALAACSFVPTVRRSACGVALGAGLVFVGLAVRAGDHPYTGALLGMGIPLLVVGVLEWTRRIWFAPAP